MRKRTRAAEPRGDSDAPLFAPGASGEPRYVGPAVQSGYGPAWGEMGGRVPSGAFRGVPPKGYRRDERIHDAVCAQLTDDDEVDATEVEVRVDDGVVFLRGRVGDRAQKRRAEVIAERARGVEDVMNELRIERAAVGSEGRH